VVDAILNPRERTKLMRYGDYFHVAVHDCAYVRDSVDSREIDIVTGPDWLVTVRHPSDNGPQVDLDEVARRFEMQRTEHHASEQGFLLWALFDVIVDGYFEVVDTIDERLDEIEEAVFRDPPPPGIPQTTFEVRRDLTTIRWAAAPMREVVNAIIRKEIDFIDEPAIVYFHDIYDRVLRVGDLIESQRDLLTGLLEANLAVTSNQLNPGDEEDDVVGRDPDRRHAHRRHLRHELPPHARAQVGVRLPTGSRLHGVGDLRALALVQAEGVALANSSSSAGRSSATSPKLRRLPITRLNRHPTSSSTIATPATIAASPSTWAGGSCTA
jgi:hypothetical protein